MTTDVSPPLATDAEPLTAVDRAWLRMDEPDNRMIITGVMLFAERIDRRSLATILEQRLLPIRRFRQRVVDADGPRPRWQDDPDFDIDQHLVTRTLEPPDDDRALQALVSEVMVAPLDPNRPLWHFSLIEDYQGGSALITRLHHAIGDGVALMLCLLSLTDLEPEGTSSPFRDLFHGDAAVRRRAAEGAEQVMPEVISLMNRAGALRARISRSTMLLRGSATFGRMSVRRADPRTLFKGPLQVAKRAVWSRRVDLDEIRTVKAHTGGTLNDVLVNTMAGGLRRYLVGRDQRVDGLDLRATIPVSLRKLDALAEMGNQFGLVFLALPVGIGDPHLRLAELRRRMEALKGSLEAGVVLAVLGALGRSPLAVQRLVSRIFGSKATAVMTNVPGPRQTLFLGGCAIRDIMFWVPQAGRLGLGISILSYAGGVRLGVVSDHGLVADPETIVAGFHDELAAMLDAAAGS